jgi:hypothetical protein
MFRRSGKKKATKSSSSAVPEKEAVEHDAPDNSEATEEVTIALAVATVPSVEVSLSTAMMAVAVAVHPSMVDDMDTPAQVAVQVAPYLIPETVDLSMLYAPDSWALSSKEAKGCILTGNKISKTNKRLRKLDIPIIASESVLFLYLKELEEKGLAGIHYDLSTVGGKKVSRTIRSALLTPGTVQLKKKGLFPKDRSGVRSIKFGLLELRALHMASRDIVMVAFQADITRDTKYAMYQTPEPARFLQPLVEATVAAYISIPNWAIPVTWSGALPVLPPISEALYTEWMGKDGGFSSAMYAAAISYHVHHKLPIGKLRGGRDSVHKRVEQQQPPRLLPPSRNNGNPQLLDLRRLIQDLATESDDGMFLPLIHHGLSALAFNLVYRSLALSNWKIPPEATLQFQESLSKALLYNVTLREIDFSGTPLTGLGESMGKSLAMNAQPLISRINLADCALTTRDLRGLLPGLARVWCGGTTALVESIVMATNMEISAPTWDLFFMAFVDPSTIPFWPHAPPPPPNLGFLQELDISKTKAVGPSLVRFAAKLSGLRRLVITPNGTLTADVLRALSIANAPLETIKADGMDQSCSHALFAFGSTLRQLTLTSFNGNVSSLLCGWPHPVPNLTIEFNHMHNNSGTDDRPSPPSGMHAGSFSPGSLVINNLQGSDFGKQALESLSANQSTGLRNLTLYGIHYSELGNAAATFAVGGLVTLHVHPPPHVDSAVISQSDFFWSVMALSKTLIELVLPDQLRGGAAEIAMVGQFLKTNRSVQNINFDSKFSMLDVESVKALRSAFYGNKKVIEMEYPAKCRQCFMHEVNVETKRQLAEVSACKAAIKRLFQSHYNKHNRRWRDTPNQLKAPFVDRIRVAKRNIGQMERDSRKIAKLLDEIKECVNQNRMRYLDIKQEKDAVTRSRRANQLQNLGRKKQKILATLVTKLHKAKRRGRKKKSAKTQVPRSTYYKSPNMWPSSKYTRHGTHHGIHSGYRYYNDPYCTRYHDNHGYYSCDADHERDCYLDDDEALAADMCACESQERGDTSSDADVVGADAPCGNPFIEGLLCDVEEMSPEAPDPWSNIDAMLTDNPEGLYSAVTSVEYLAAIHEEATELGPDVVADIRGALDDGAAVDLKLDEIAASTDISRDTLEAEVDRGLDASLDMEVLQSTMDTLPDYKSELDADDAVGMYAGAGPRDLEDGGPSFGGSSNAALAGARRRARTRKANRDMIRAHTNTTTYMAKNGHGYKSLSLVPNGQSTATSRVVEAANWGAWPEDLFDGWMQETRANQINAMSQQSDLFQLPDVSVKEPVILMEWRGGSDQARHSKSKIEVALVTQCSIDRLKNLEAQLTGWSGKASVAIYLRADEDVGYAKTRILSSIESARTNASGSGLDVAIAVVKGCMEEEPYPINYLRNVALLEAQRQHLRVHTSLAKSAVLLVDVDFRPSRNLHSVLHHADAANIILHQRKVVVCPAFESTQSQTLDDGILGRSNSCPLSIENLRRQVDNHDAEGFHLSHFPQGHGPTCFDRFWKESHACDSNSTTDDAGSNCWERLYKVNYEEYFEPYVVMASLDVPVYDERFQGYGLNKVSHLASVVAAKSKACRDDCFYFFVLPGVFLVAPVHERSKSWSTRYGSSCLDETRFNQLWLKGLYCNFTSRLKLGNESVVCQRTALKRLMLIALQQKEGTTKNQSTESMGAVPIVQGSQYNVAVSPLVQTIVCS